MEERKQFTFYTSFERSVRKLPRRFQLALYDAIIDYALYNKEPEGLNSAQQSAFEMCRPNLDTARRRAAAGQIGGRISKRSKISKSKEEEEKENEIENETEIENEIKDDCLWREGFEKFWDAFPVKIGKDKAAEVWQAELPDAEAVCRGLERWKKSKQWNRENKRFIPRAAKFLEEKHHVQVPEDAMPKGVEGQLGQAEMEAIEKVMKQGN